MGVGRPVVSCPAGEPALAADRDSWRVEKGAWPPLRALLCASRGWGCPRMLSACLPQVLRRSPWEMLLHADPKARVY